MTLALAAFVSALAGSPHCAGMCGPFALAACHGPTRTASWQVGKLTTYMGLGAVAAALGAALLPPGWIAASVSVLLVVWFSAVLAGLLPDPRWAPPGLARILSARAAGSEETGSGGAASAFVFGLANGLLPCGLVYAALGLAIASGDPLSGAFVMAAFGLGTVPALTATVLGARRFRLNTVRARRALAAVVLVAGLGSIGVRHALSPDHGHASVQTESVP